MEFFKQKALYELKEEIGCEQTPSIPMLIKWLKDKATFDWNGKNEYGMFS